MLNKSVDERLTMHPIGSAEWLLILLSAVIELEQSIEKLEARLDRLDGRIHERSI